MFRPAFVLLFLSTFIAAAPLFDGKSLDGWEGNLAVWRVGNGTILGGSLDGNPRNEFLATKRPYKNFVLRFEYKLDGTEGFVNGGVQFHSQRIPQPPNEMSGYQADIGAKFTGCLYDESRRKTVLAAADEKAVSAIEKPGQWNRYEVRAEGDRIRFTVNGLQTIDYTEKDPTIPLHGYIALQIHGDCKAVIAFRNIDLEPLPDDVAPDGNRILNRFGDPSASWPDGKFTPADHETFILTGQTNLVREQKSGTLEASLSIAHAAKKPVFRSMAWEADTVYEQWRDLNFGSWEGQLKASGATAVICQFGQMEALDGIRKLPQFIAAYHRLLDQFAAVSPRHILISPIPFEKPRSPHAPDLAQRNREAQAYAEAIRVIAQQRSAIFVDLFTPLSSRQTRLTQNGVHLTDEGLKTVASLIANQLGASHGDRPPHPALLTAIISKNRLWFDCWRPANWSFVYGDRISQAYGKAIGDVPSLRAAFESHKPLIAAKDAEIHTLAEGRIPPPSSPTPASTLHVDPPVTPGQQIAQFKLAEGYQINLFADETLGVSKPVQFSWDETGRLFVACSPTYPQTLPGIEPSDYILILEDTDGDGKADKSTRFAEGLTMVQGVEPGAGGVYVCDFDQILHLKDTDGDGKADQKTIVLSGFGIGDTHQLVNSISHGPDGTLWFTQGLHAFSRVETPHGIARLDKAGVWKFNPRTLELTGYFNGGTAGHNCWGVAFDDWFQPFHKSGDRPHGYYSLPGLIDLKDPADYHSVANLFESSPKTTALEIIGTKALPDNVQGTALIAGYFGSVIELHRLIGDGSGFTSQQLPRLLTSADQSFRPVDVGVGPDGGIYVADWFNPVIGHYQASYADPRRDRTHGRLWRITSKSLPSIKQPHLAEMSVPGLLDQLKSPERWTRYQARRLLSDRPSSEVIPATLAWHQKLDRASSDDPHLTIEAVAILRSHEQGDGDPFSLALSSLDPRAVAYAVRAIGESAPANGNVHEILFKSAHHPHPRVRLEAIVASSHLDTSDAVRIPLAALKHPRDRFIDYAIRHSVRKLQSLWQPAGKELLLPDAEQAAYLNNIAGAAPAEKHPGEIIYESLCLNCHQPGGKGLPGVYPPLTPTEWISSDPSVPIRILLHGITGPMPVAGKEYGTTIPLPMPPMGLNDQQTADVLSYIRSSFGNQSPNVTPEQVRQVRSATHSRSTFWTAGELSH